MLEHCSAAGHRHRIGFHTNFTDPHGQKLLAIPGARVEQRRAEVVVQAFGQQDALTSALPLDDRFISPPRQNVFRVAAGRASGSRFHTARISVALWLYRMQTFGRWTPPTAVPFEVAESDEPEVVPHSQWQLELPNAIAIPQGPEKPADKEWRNPEIGQLGSTQENRR